MSDARMRIPSRLAVAGTFLFALSLLAAPAHASASSLFWGVESGDPVQIEIMEGGAYSPPLEISAPAYISTSIASSRGPYGDLYHIGGTPEEPVRTHVATIYPHSDPESGTLDAEFAWSSTGSYELEIYATPPRDPPPPQQALREKALRSLARIFFFDIAYAALGTPARPVLQETIHFTIEEAAPVCTERCFSNVLFLPGIESSRLYRPDYNGGTERLWEPGSNQDVEDLFLTADGQGLRSDVYTKEGDVVDELPVLGKNIYKSFIAGMDALKADGSINDWQAASYDWRLSLDDVLRYGNEIDGRIYYTGDLRATSTPYIIQELRRLAAGSKSGKVTIIAHSNGGLVAKYLTTVLGSEASDLIDKIIFVAVPQVGTPMAIAAGLHGYDQANGRGLITTDAAARSFASTSPMFYHLLPSAAYMDAVDTPVVSFDAELTDWIDRYGDSISSEIALEHFLADAYGRTSNSEDTDQPIQLSTHLLEQAKSVHTTLDSWQPPAGIELIEIAGWGVPGTVSGVTYKKVGDAVEPDPEFTIDGDGTVVIPSALWTGNNTTRYWVNLAEYNRLTNKIPSFRFVDLNHGNILEIAELRQYISDSIRDSVLELDTYEFLSDQAPSSNVERLSFSLHSPLTLDIFDNLGNHTGVSTTTGEIEEQVPGTYYVEFGDVKYIFADAGTPLHIVMTGYDSGTFTFEIGQLLGDSTVASTTFSNVPTSPTTIAYFDISTGLTSSSNLSIDDDGDGEIDSSYASSTGELIHAEDETLEEESTAPPASASTGNNANGPIVGLIAETTGLVLGATSTATSTIETVSNEEGDAATTTAGHVLEPTKPVSPVKKSAQKKETPTKSTAPNVQLATPSSTQPTGRSLWSRMMGWIMKKLNDL